MNDRSFFYQKQKNKHCRQACFFKNRFIPLGSSAENPGAFGLNIFFYVTESVEINGRSQACSPIPVVTLIVAALEFVVWVVAVPIALQITFVRYVYGFLTFVSQQGIHTYIRAAHIVESSQWLHNAGQLPQKALRYYR